MVWIDTNQKEHMKKSKKQEVPSIYEGLEMPTKKTSGRCIVGRLGQFYVLPSHDSLKSHPEFTSEHMVLESFEKFLEMREMEIGELHLEIFKAQAPKGTDKTHAAGMIWSWLCKNATPLIDTAKVDADGEKVKTARKSTIGTRVYTLGDVRDINAIKTPQAKSCYQILCDSLTPAKSEGDVPFVTEDQLRKAIIARASELKTKQDPWRIFQYYRPSLLAAKMLKHD